MIDTIGVSYRNKDQKRLGSKPYIVINNCRYEENSTYLCVRHTNKKLMSVSEFLVIKKVIDDYFEETGIIKRMDFSLDLISYLDNDVKTKKLLISCVAIIRNISLDNFHFTSSHVTRKNLKIRNSKGAFTIYNCSDKPWRGRKTRIESRFYKLSIKKNVQNDTKKLVALYISELNKTTSVISNVEEYCAERMKKEWKKEYPDKKDHDKLSSSKLTSHINAMNKMDLVLTRNTIRLFLEKIGYKHNIDKYIERYRQNYPQANFTTKTNLIELIKSIKKDLKKTLS